MKNKKTNKISAILAFATGLFSLLPQVALAAYSVEPLPGTITNVATVIQRIVNWFLAFVAITAVLFIVIGGVLYITSAGNQDRVKQAKQTLTYAIIGLIVVVLSYFIVSFTVHVINGFV